MDDYWIPAFAGMTMRRKIQETLIARAPLCASARTPGNFAPPSHSRKAPPAVET